jgi:hypothetical protein
MRNVNRYEVNAMERLIELYEMASLNNAALHDNEKLAILKAKLALNIFERAMDSFKKAAAEPLTVQEPRFLIAA